VVASKAGANFTFVTRNTGVLNESVSVALIEGPFDALEGEWHFKALGNAGCRVDFRLSFAASGLLSRLINPIAHSVADRMVDAFSHRITALADRAEAL
jgi:ribosome-associated toxin RatA of RatAB toxin-antitoxin module